MPVITGLYTLVLPMLAFAIFGSSRHLVVGRGLGDGRGPGDRPRRHRRRRRARVAAVGRDGRRWRPSCARVVHDRRPGSSGSGFIANFLSHSVLIGFLTGVGIQVAMGQFGGLFGVSEGSGTTLQKFANALQAIAAGETSLPTLAVSIAVLAIIVGLGRVNKKIPGALIAVVGMIVAELRVRLRRPRHHDHRDGPRRPAADRPAGHPGRSAGWPTSRRSCRSCSRCSSLILAQSAATSRAYAMKYDDSFDENVDLVGLGLGNLAAGISGTFVVNGSPTKTEMVDSAGGRSQIAQLTTGAIVVVVLLFLTGPLSYMPNAVLAAVVFLIGLKLVDYRGMAGIYRAPARASSRSPLVTAATVVVVGVEQGIILAIVLSLIVVPDAQSTSPHDRVVAIAPDGTPHARPGRRAASRPRPAWSIYRFGASCTTRTRPASREEIMEHRRGRRSAAAVARARRGRHGRHRLLGRRHAPPGPRRAGAAGRHGSCCARSTRRSGSCSTPTA